MPYETDVNETHHYWCPKWYWPFAICTRTVRVHKWCYNFSWVEETGYFFFSHDQGCENGTLYSWNAFSFGIVGAHYYGGGTMCFNSPLSRGGRCADGSVYSAALTASVDAPHMQAAAGRRRISFRGPRSAEPAESGEGANSTQPHSTHQTRSD